MNGTFVFCNCSTNVQSADSKNIFTCLTLDSFFTLSKDVNNYIYLREDAGKFMCVYIEPDSAVCVRVMFNNHHNNFLTDTPQIRPDEKRHGISKSYEFVLTEIACKR